MEEENSLDFEPPGTTQKIPLTYLIPPTKENYLFYKNGLSKYLDKLVVKVYSNIEVCQQLWEQFSPNQSLFQLWEFRYAWYLGYQYQPFFYTIQLNNQPLAVLPLWFDKLKKQYQWFGGYWPEDNVFFVKDEKFILFLLKIAPAPLLLSSILPSKNLGALPFVNDEEKYVQQIDQFKKIDDFLMILNKKNRYHIKNFYTRFQQYNPYIYFTEENLSEKLILLRNLSIIDHERHDISKFREKERLITFKQIYKQKGRYKIITLLVKIQNYDFAFDILAVYKKQFYILAGAADLERFPGGIHYLTYLEIEKAIENGYQFIDVMQGDYNWKHKYFTSQPMLKFEKK